MRSQRSSSPASSQKKRQGRKQTNPQKSTPPPQRLLMEVVAEAINEAGKDILPWPNAPIVHAVYIAGLIDSIPALAGMVVNRTNDSLTLSNDVCVEVRAASFRGLRGVTAIAVLCDESCFWRTDKDSANGDAEIISAVMPSLATTRWPLVLISSPYGKFGETYALYARHFGPQGDELVLIAQGASRDFNPSLPQSAVDRAMERDATSARAEYLAIWRDDLSSYVDRAAVEACVDDYIERIPTGGHVAFLDAAGGSGKDAVALGLAHREGDVAVLDALRWRDPPFSPKDVVAEFAALMRRFGVLQATCDGWGSGWVAEAFREEGVRLEQRAAPKAQIYLEMLSAINSTAIRLPNIPRLIDQICALERRPRAGGRDVIDAPRGAPLAAKMAARFGFHVPALGPSLNDIRGGRTDYMSPSASAPPGGWPANSPQASAVGGQFAWTHTRGTRQ